MLIRRINGRMLHLSILYFLRGLQPSWSSDASRKTVNTSNVLMLTAIATRLVATAAVLRSLARITRGAQSPSFLGGGGGGGGGVGGWRGC